MPSNASNFTPAAEDTPDELLVSGVTRLGISLSAEAVTAFRVYREELLRWSKRMNLTAFSTPSEVVGSGFLDSLLCLSILPKQASRLLDIGSGAGFPAIPIAIADSRLAITLVEPSRKRITFLRHIVRQLKLRHVRILSCRAEALLAQGAMLAAFDAALARAVAPLIAVARLIRPFLRPGGVFIAQVGAGADSLESLAEILKGKDFELAGKVAVPNWLGAPGRQVVCLRRTAT